MACGAVRARRAQVFCARHPPGGPSCARPLRRGWRRVRAWPRLRPVAAPPIARGLARTGGAARTTPSAASGLHRVHGPSCGPFGRPVLAARPRLGPRPWPDRRQRRAAPQASKQGSKGGLVPPWTPQPSAYGARQRARRPDLARGLRSNTTQGPECGLRRTDGTPFTARLAGRSVVRFWQCGRCFGPRAPVRRRRQPRSLRSAPRRGRLRRGFDPAAGPGQRLVVAAARSAPGAMSDWCGEGEPIGARDHGQQLRQPRQEGPRCGPAVGTERARLGDSGQPPRGSTASKQGGRAAPLGPPARMARGRGRNGLEPHRGYRPPPLPRAPTRPAVATNHDGGASRCRPRASHRDRGHRGFRAGRSRPPPRLARIVPPSHRL